MSLAFFNKGERGFIRRFLYICTMYYDLDKKYYRIREVAALTELPTSTLRFWETQFKIVNPKRNAHGVRLYTPEDVECIRMIKYLVKDKGLKIEAAQEQIRLNRNNVSRKHDALRRLTDVRGKLEDLLHALSSRNQ